VIANLLDIGTYTHETINSKESRTYQNPLFPVNYIDRELRKDLANHVRETTRYAREANHMMDRVNVYLVDHNLNKKFRIKSKKEETSWHWQEAGIPLEKVEVGTDEKFLARPWRSESWSSSFKRMWDRNIPGPESKAKEYLAGFWMM